MNRATVSAFVELLRKQVASATLAQSVLGLEQMIRALAASDGAEVREAIRGLVESIKLTPEAGELAIEVKGDLAAILALASGTKTGASLTANQALVQGIKMVAGTGFGFQLLTRTTTRQM